MPITYALIAKGNIVLCESYMTVGPHTNIARHILSMIPLGNHKKSYTYEGLLFHYTSDEKGIICMCMADEKTPHKLCYAFLQELRPRFMGLYADGLDNATELSFNDRFLRILRERMDYYSNDPDADKTTRIQKDIDEVKDQMKQNITLVLDRSEKIELLKDKTESLETQSSRFKKSSTSLSRSMWLKNIKVWIALICVIVIILIVIMVVIVVLVKIFA